MSATGGPAPTPTAIAPIVAIPTTAGTGSEVGRAGVITDETTHTKKIIFHPRMMPRTAILDPEVTVGLPPKLTAATGMDALAHCLEAYCAPTWHPMARGDRRRGHPAGQGSPCRGPMPHGADLEARGMMLAAAAMGATAFQKGLGAIHSLSHPIGAVYDTHHGLTNAVVMPYVLVFNRAAIEPKIERLAAWLGIDGGFAGFLDWILALRAELGVPHTLQELGVPTDRFDELAAMAVADPTAGGNPEPLDPAPAPTGCWPRPIRGRPLVARRAAGYGHALRRCCVDSLWVLLTRLVMRAANFAVFVLLARSLSVGRVRLLRLRHVDGARALDRVRPRPAPVRRLADRPGAGGRSGGHHASGGARGSCWAPWACSPAG